MKLIKIILISLPGLLQSTSGDEVTLQGNFNYKLPYQITLDTTQSYLFLSHEKKQTYLLYFEGEWISGDTSLIEIEK